jgi:hypothetical protein
VLLSAGLLTHLVFGLPAPAAVSPSEATEWTSPTIEGSSDDWIDESEAQRVETTSDQLVGILYSGAENTNSRLVTFDIESGTIVHTHLRLDQHESFLGLAHDRRHHKIYAMSIHPAQHNLYTIDTRTLATRHMGNLRIDLEPFTFTDAEGLAYDPRSETLFTAVQHESPPYRPEPRHIWTDLARVDPLTLQLSIVGHRGSAGQAIAFNETDGQLYGLARHGRVDGHLQRGRIDPETEHTTRVCRCRTRACGASRSRGHPLSSCDQ